MIACGRRQLQALRERLGKLRQQIHPPSMEAPATQGASGDVMGVDFRNQATGMPQQNVLSEHTSQWQQVQQVYPPVPRDDRRANAQANGLAGLPCVFGTGNMG